MAPENQSPSCLSGLHIATPEWAGLPQASLARDNTQVPRYAQGIYALDDQLWFWGHSCERSVEIHFFVISSPWFFSARSWSTPIHSTMLATSAYLTQPCVRTRGLEGESKAFKKPEEKKDGSINRKRERWTNVLLGGCLKEHGRS